MRLIQTDIRGFSLIELTVMIIIVGILAAVAMQSMTSVVEDARQVKTKMEMESLAEAIVGDPTITSGGVRSAFGYVGDVGAFPSSIDNLITNPGGYATWNGPYLVGRFAQDSLGMKTDEWGAAYGYSGGTVITSTGSGSSITKKIADATSDYLLNSLSGTIKDAVDSVPGITYLDSVDILVTIPNGGGGTVTKTYLPDSAGIFLLDSLPAGTHSLDIIYTPNVDTLHRYVTILPRHKSSVSYKFASAYFGGGIAEYNEILRPVGAGSQSNLSTENCSAGWQCVDESVSDDDGSFVKGSGNSYSTDSYAIQNSAAGIGVLDSVIVSMNCKGGGGGMQAKTILRTYATNYEGSMVNLNPISAYSIFSTTYINNPSTTSPWTWTEIDDLEAGVSIRKEGKCTQVWIEVYYTN